MEEQYRILFIFAGILLSTYAICHIFYAICTYINKTIGNIKHEYTRIVTNVDNVSTNLSNISRSLNTLSLSSSRYINMQDKLSKIIGTITIGLGLFLIISSGIEISPLIRFAMSMYEQNNNRQNNNDQQMNNDQNNNDQQMNNLYEQLIRQNIINPLTQPNLGSINNLIPSRNENINNLIPSRNENINNPIIDIQIPSDLNQIKLNNDNLNSESDSSDTESVDDVDLNENSDFINITAN